MYEEMCPKFLDTPVSFLNVWPNIWKMEEFIFDWPKKKKKSPICVNKTHFIQD